MRRLELHMHQSMAPVTSPSLQASDARTAIKGAKPFKLIVATLLGSPFRASEIADPHRLDKCHHRGKWFKQVKSCPDTEPPECRLDVVQEGWGVLGVVARFHASAGRRAIQMCLFTKAGGVSREVNKNKI